PGHRPVRGRLLRGCGLLRRSWHGSLLLLALRPCGFACGLPRWRLPVAKLFDCTPHLAGLVLHEALVVVAHAVAEPRIDLVVPLLQPRQQLGQAGQQRHQTRVVTSASCSWTWT